MLPGHCSACHLPISCQGKVSGNSNNNRAAKSRSCQTGLAQSYPVSAGSATQRDPNNVIGRFPFPVVVFVSSNNSSASTNPFAPFVSIPPTRMSRKINKLTTNNSTHQLRASPERRPLRPLGRTPTAPRDRFGLKPNHQRSPRLSPRHSISHSYSADGIGSIARGTQNGFGLEFR